MLESVKMHFFKKRGGFNGWKKFNWKYDGVEVYVCAYKNEHKYEPVIDIMCL